MIINQNRIMKVVFFLQLDNILPNLMNTSNGREISLALRKD